MCGKLGHRADGLLCGQHDKYTAAVFDKRRKQAEEGGAGVDGRSAAASSSGAATLSAEKITGQKDGTGSGSKNWYRIWGVLGGFFVVNLSTGGGTQSQGADQHPDAQ